MKISKNSTIILTTLQMKFQELREGRSMAEDVRNPVLIITSELDQTEEHTINKLRNHNSKRKREPSRDVVQLKRCKKCSKTTLSDNMTIVMAEKEENETECNWKMMSLSKISKMSLNLLKAQIHMQEGDIILIPVTAIKEDVEDQDAW